MIYNKPRKIDKASVESLLLNHRLQDLKPQFFTIENDDVELGVGTLAEEQKTDLVLIIPKKHGPFHKAWSNEFIYYSRFPVMAIHEEDTVCEPEEEVYSLN